MMILFKNGFVVAKINNIEEFSYESWPLSNIHNDLNVNKLLNEADNRWFTRFDMQEIVPDLNYVKRYLNNCKRLNIDAKILLFESSEKILKIHGKYKIYQELGFDCIGTVYYSYLRSDYCFLKNNLKMNNIILNKYGLFGEYDDVISFIDIRKQAITLGYNLERFWKPMPVKLSLVTFN